MKVNIILLILLVVTIFFSFLRWEQVIQIKTAYIPIKPRGVYVGSVWDLHPESAQIGTTTIISKPVKKQLKPQTCYKFMEDEVCQ